MQFPKKPLNGPQRLAAGIFAVSIIALLGFFRMSTDAEFAVASAAIIPVVLISWLNGVAWGGAISVVAASMWAFSDQISARQFSSSWIPYANGLTRLATYAFIAYLTATTRKLLMKQTELATHDALTEILNRHSFMEAGKAEASRALRYGTCLAVVFIDLDNFKQLNDNRGHVTGDAALKAVAGSLRRSLRETDHVARLGGDEFAVLLPEITENAASQAGHKISAAIATALAKFPPASSSIGVAWFEKPKEDFSAMVKAADTLMYEMKREAKGGVRTQAFKTMAPGNAQL